MQYELPKSYDELAKAYIGLRSRLEQLEEMMRLMQRGRFAAKSEKLTHPGMQPLFKEEEDLAESESEDNQAAEVEVKGHRHKVKRQPLPEGLPREDIFCDLAESEKVCNCCHKPMVKTHERSSEKLHVKPAEFSVKRFITPVYACKSCQQAKQATMPVHPIPKCGVTTTTLAHIIVSKFIDGLPLHRLEKIFAREGVDLKRDKMSRWLVTLGKKCAPLKNLLHEDLLAGGCLAMDETPLQVLREKGRRPDQKSWFLAQAREGPPGKAITLFHYEKSRSSEAIGSYLKGFQGSLLTDGLGVYVSFAGLHNKISHGGCYSHARRKFTDAVKGKKGNACIAKKAVSLIAELFKIESSLKTLSSAEKLARRDKLARPIVEQLEELWREHIDLIPSKSLTGKGLHYLKNQWPLLTRFLKDPNLEIHNNYLERQIRTVAIGRKAWLFADTTDGADASSVFYSLLSTAKANGLHPTKYLTNVLDQIGSASDLRTLLPYA